MRHSQNPDRNMCDSTALPFFINGEVIKGFGRGSKELGIPTANFPLEVVNKLPDSITTGIYYGWAQVDDSSVYKMVMSVGWNPYYKNKEKSMETHIIHKFETDFYGKNLKVALVGYIRPELNFASMDDLINTIHNDIKQAEIQLEKPEQAEIAKNDFFKPNC
ncbi:riboflavin kinase [Onthophagus taurus]|uniref:riboflavin kinase n=1 Tax=Onthophagus taurus TaxID=166361 RepID=UPI000C20046D|nr:riboflavin kinase [Onthophagus taurus]XP_022909810.1 riboflavin kinase [Onthophagus taurus]XP_022909818.1 riboflavin kinase [Onthophagus taurus]